MLKNAIKMCRLWIGEDEGILDEEIEMSISQVTAMPKFNNVDKSRLRNELLALYSVRVGSYEVLEGKKRREPWIKYFKSKHPVDYWQFWNRYMDYLQNTKGFAPKTINSLDEFTEDILDKLYDPTRQDIEVSKKGLVVGQVQSGKTANYTGLICKAADAGFNLIIVLAGIHNNLRSQTQLRLDEGFLGFDTQYERAYTMNSNTKLGVGLVPGYNNAIASSITTSADQGDFSRGAANSLGVNFNTPQPILVVVKKNSSVLKRLFAWLNSQTIDNGKGENRIVNKSLLVIDDEADNASINTKKLNETPTAINGLIRQITSLFNRSAYIGYTATPFANIFIPTAEDDLFPRDFIFNLKAPSNYIGPDKIFGTSCKIEENDDALLPIVRIVNDYNLFVPDKHKRDDDKPDDLPESLKLAIKSFIITCAIRILRGDGNKHNSMLVHVTRFVAWQNHIKDLVENQFKFYKRGIEQNIPSIIEELRTVFEVDTKSYTSYCSTTNNILNSNFSNIDQSLIIHSWNDVKSKLYNAVSKIEVKSINGKSIDTLKYYDNEHNGISVIAIGGDKLSRGLTLEGLSVSYYLRASKMYDTLMQMGRWFGYRKGYVDLCRLYTSEELNEWFRHITLASEELRDEFTYLKESGATPEDYAVKVRTHPGCLQITAVSKMRNVDTVRISWSGRLIETYLLSLDKSINHANNILTDSFLSSLGCFEHHNKRGFLWRDISSTTVCNYLNNFCVSKNLKKVDLPGIVRFINKLNQFEELTSWSVVLMSKEQTNVRFELSNKISAGCFIRNRDEATQSSYLIRNNHILRSYSDEFIDLPQELLDEALKQTKSIDPSWTNNYPKPKIVRERFRHKSNPLLIIYPLDPRGANLSNNQDVYSCDDEPFISFVISFPKGDTDLTEEYAINSCLIDSYRESEEEFYFTNDNDDKDE